MLAALLLGLSELVASETGDDAVRANRATNSPAVVTPITGAKAKIAQAAISKAITAQVSELGLQPSYLNWIVTNLCAIFPRLPSLKATLDRTPNDAQNVALALCRDINAALEINKGSNPALLFNSSAGSWWLPSCAIRSDSGVYPRPCTGS
ncbi:MAG: hypothetical protein ABSC03_12625 [Verrucomicrobiota bacterium]|jgi:hypothetical protein